MPVKSKAQWRKFYAMYQRGEISKATLDEWTGGVSYKSLPSKKKTKKRKVAKATKRAQRPTKAKKRKK